MLDNQVGVAVIPIPGPPGPQGPQGESGDGKITVDDTDNDVTYTLQLKLIGGKPVVEYTQQEEQL